MIPQKSSSEQFSPLIIPDKVAMIDIDETLIDNTYAITDDQIYGAIQDAQQQGWRVGLSSDTPLETMQEWREEFGMNGPIIAEKGALVSVGDETFATAPAPYDFVALKNSLLDSVDPSTVVYKGNAVQFLRSRSNALGEPGDRVLLVNERRNHSLGFYARVVDEDGLLSLDTGVTDSFIAQTRALYPEDGSFDEDVNYEHGLLIVSHEGMHKRTGTTKLQQIMGIGRIAMIGNSKADYVGSDIAVHLAVGNATNEYKQVADYIAQRNLTSGVIDALNTLEYHNK